MSTFHQQASDAPAFASLPILSTLYNQSPRGLRRKGYRYTADAIAQIQSVTNLMTTKEIEEFNAQLERVLYQSNRLGEREGWLSGFFRADIYVPSVRYADSAAQLRSYAERISQQAWSRSQSVFRVEVELDDDDDLPGMAPGASREVNEEAVTLAVPTRAGEQDGHVRTALGSHHANTTGHEEADIEEVFSDGGSRHADECPGDLGSARLLRIYRLAQL